MAWVDGEGAGLAQVRVRSPKLRIPAKTLGERRSEGVDERVPHPSNVPFGSAVEYRRRAMRPLLALSALFLAGCAKFPSEGTNTSSTRLAFRFTMADAVNPNYIYLVAIRPQFSTDPVDDNFGPVPVYFVSGDSNPKNGFVEGRPTRYVLYTPGIGATQYQIKGFGTRTPTANDDNPIDLANIVDKGEPILGIDPSTNGLPNTLGFDIETRDLVDNAADASKIVAIQFNIITMNKALRTRPDAAGRVLDALGDQSFSTIRDRGYYRAIVTTSNLYRNATSTNVEREGDTYGGTLPAIDITDWSLEVRPQ